MLTFAGVAKVLDEEEGRGDGTIEAAVEGGREGGREEDEEAEGDGVGAGAGTAIGFGFFANNFFTLAANSSRVRKPISTKELSIGAASVIGKAKI